MSLPRNSFLVSEVCRFPTRISQWRLESQFGLLCSLLIYTRLGGRCVVLVLRFMVEQFPSKKTFTDGKIVFSSSHPLAHLLLAKAIRKTPRLQVVANGLDWMDGESFRQGQQLVKQFGECQPCFALQRGKAEIQINPRSSSSSRCVDAGDDDRAAPRLRLECC